MIRAAAKALRVMKEAQESPESLHEVQATVTAWQYVFEGIEAHLLDRIAMKDEANPQRYLDIIRADVRDVMRSSEQIVKSRWADIASLKATAYEVIHDLLGTMSMKIDEVDRLKAKYPKLPWADVRGAVYNRAKKLVS